MTEIVVNPELGQLGAYGIEARHTFGNVTLNNLSAFPFYKLDAKEGILGLTDMPDSDEAVDAGYSRTGEVPRTAFLRGKTVTYSGRIVATTPQSLAVARSQLITACASRAVQRVDVIPHSDYASGAQFFEGRAISCLIPDRVPSPSAMPTPFQRPFVIAFRLYDPRIYDAAPLVAESGAIVASAATATFNNPGSAPTEPVIEIHGPITNPTVENTTQSRKVVFQNITVVQGDFLEVDFANRTVKKNGIDDFRIKLNRLSTNWWDAGINGLEPGTNSLKLTGTSFTAPAKIVVRFYAALWG